MNWIQLTTLEGLSSIAQKSYDTPQVIFKHSTRCSISSMALNRLGKAASPSNVDFHFLDLIAHRDISNAISEQFNVPHQSPQILLIKNGNCIFHESHSSIYMDDIAAEAIHA
jgi:bacillithiol system protein YtxJ